MLKKRMNCRVAKIIREFLEGNKEEALAMIKKLKMADKIQCLNILTNEQLLNEDRERFLSKNK